MIELAKKHENGSEGFNKNSIIEKMKLEATNHT
jgi:hypothetical protein